MFELLVNGRHIVSSHDIRQLKSLRGLHRRYQKLGERLGYGSEQDVRIVDQKGTEVK